MAKKQKKKNLSFTQWLSSFFGMLMFGGAVWFLHRELQKYRIEDIFAQLQSISITHIAIALILAFFGHLALTWFDLLGMKYVQAKIPYRRVALASFVSYSLSHNMGFAAVTGAPFRFRVYHDSGLTPFQITTVVAFCGLTFWVGFFSLTGFLFLLETQTLSFVFGMEPFAIRAIGISFLFIITLYVFWSWMHNKTIKLFKWKLWPPDVKIALSQIGVSALDWALAGSVLYVLFPSHVELNFLPFLAVFCLAQVSGFSSQVPGGLGVFESVFIEFLTPEIPITTVLGTLLAYRGIYYLLPLAIGASTLGISELLRKKRTQFKHSHTQKSQIAS